MIRRRHVQRNLGEVVLYGLMVPEPDALMAPPLGRIDQVLEDETLVDQVLAALRQRRPLSARRGRPGTPAEVVVQLLVLKHLKGWSYDRLEWEVTGNLVYRRFGRIDGAKVPDAKTLVRLGQLLDGPVLRGVTDSAGKLLSVFEPYAQILRRGKLHRPKEFGLLVKVQEAEGGVVTDVGLVPEKADAPLLVPSVERHVAVFGRAPQVADRPGLLFHRRGAPDPCAGRGTRGDPQTGLSLTGPSRVRTATLVPGRTSVARRWRSAHRLPETPLRHGP